MPSPQLRYQLALWNAHQKAARDAYAYTRAHEDHPKRRRTCAGCGRRHYSREDRCRNCQKATAP